LAQEGEKEEGVSHEGGDEDERGAGNLGRREEAGRLEATH